MDDFASEINSMLAGQGEPANEPSVRCQRRDGWWLRIRSRSICIWIRRRRYELVRPCGRNADTRATNSGSNCPAPWTTPSLPECRRHCQQ